jgi:diacylglycerol kinase family enzyme
VAARVAIILNPHSGTAPDQGSLDRALRAAGVSADIHTVQHASTFSDWMTGITRQYDILVAAGGDGTVSSVAAAVVSTGKILGVIPTGTLNHFAQDAGIPLAVNEALAAIAAGQTRVFDCGEVNGHVFINNASVGAYPRLVVERDRARRKGLPRSVATSLAVVRTWLKLRTITVRLCVDGRELIRRTPFVVVGNSEYEVEGIQFGKRPGMTDGKLSLYVLPESGRLDSLALSARALLRRLKDHQKFETYAASSISIELSRRRVAVALDGEIRLLDPPLRFRVRRQALRTLVPPTQDK